MKMFKLVLFFALIPTLISYAQVGIGTTNPNATLDIQSSDVTTPANTDGILIPKIDEYPAVNPTAAQDGMLVFVTGNGGVTKGFYYWDNTVTSWEALAGVGSSGTVERINDLIDGKSDNDGSQDGSSLFFGVDAGLNDDSTNNFNVGIGYQTMSANTAGGANAAVGYQALLNNTTGLSNAAFGSWALRDNINGGQNAAFGLHTLLVNTTGSGNAAFGAQSLNLNESGDLNTAIGHRALYDIIDSNNNVAIGYYAGNNTNGDNNVFLGVETGSGGAADTKEGSIFIGYQSGFLEDNSNRLYIENSDSTSPLIYGEFDTNLLRVNGDFEVEKTTDTGLKIKTNDGNSSSIALYEGADYGFEFLYTGSNDKLNLWSRNFAGNEAERMTWLKNGRVGINDASPTALLDMEASNSAAPANTDGILIPRIDAFPTSNPTADQNGMLVFLTTDSTFYYWRNSGTSWVPINSGGSHRINDLVDGKSDNDGTDNGSSIFLGINAGANDDDTDNRNVGIGLNAMRDNTSGSNNTGVGYSSLQSNTTGYGNTATGSSSLLTNTTGYANTSTGNSALRVNTTGHGNTS
ncbi:MAG: hypothetical protein KUG68_09085, partial [Flavobacteriaceae bacterium]|nr:hypothetical protein [Flavobacteriaceae bacterium]